MGVPSLEVTVSFGMTSSFLTHQVPCEATIPTAGMMPSGSNQR
jgi:hypothetical protein